MKKTFLLVCTASVLVWSCNDAGSGTSGTETPKDTTVTATEKKAPQAMPDSAAMMKNWQAYMTPGDVHKMMASWDGEWVGDVTMWHSPDAPPQTSKLATTNKMILGGRYQSSTNKGDMMGMPFEGMGTMGYDNAKKAFVNTWIDNMGTGIMTMEGQWDEATKSITATGKCVAAEMGDGSEMGVKEVFKIIDNDHQTMEMYMVAADGKETKTMEIKYARKK